MGQLFLKVAIFEAMMVLESKGYGWLANDITVIGMTKQELLKIDDSLKCKALYDANTKTIYMVWPPFDQKNPVQRLLHEYGHKLWDSLKRSSRLSWKLRFVGRKLKGGPFATKYSSKSPEEDFCEVFALWILDRLPVTNGDYYETLLRSVL